MAERVRIQKVIARSGLMSRRKAEAAIEEGRVQIGGRIAILGDRVDVENESLTLDGVPLQVNPEIETHLLYKPVGVISSSADTHGRLTVVDLVGSDKRLYPVGRLDMDSEGLILVSNDGDLTNRVTHPRYGITKTYLALVDGTPGDAEMRRLMKGVMLEDGLAEAHGARIVDKAGGKSMIEVVMHEGRNREVRRMLSAVGFPVERLVRTAIGDLADRTLRPGESRLLTAEEIHQLMESGS